METIATTEPAIELIAQTPGRKTDGLERATMANETQADTGEVPGGDSKDGQAATEQDHGQYPTGFAFWTIISTLGIVLILSGLDGNIVATAVPRITDDFHSTADVGWYSAGYKLTACGFQFMFGKAYTLFSMKRIFLIAICIFLVGSVLCATAATSTMFVVGRAVTGLGFAGILSGAFAIVTTILPLHRRPVYTGMLAGIESISVIVAPILGGVLTDSLSWRWCFYINLPIGGVALFTVAIFFSNLRAPTNNELSFWQKIELLDLVGNVLFIPSLTCLFIALSWAGTKYSWSSPTIIGLLVTFVVLLAGFSYEQRRRGDKAAIPPRILRHRSVLAGVCFSLCNNSAMNVLEYYLPTYYQAVREISAAESGYLLLPIILGFAVATLLQGPAISWLGYYTPFMLFTSVLLPIGAGLMTTWKVHTGLARLIVYTAVTGFAGGIGFQAPQSAVQTVLPIEDVPIGLAVILFAQSFGPAVFLVVAQTVFTNLLAANLGEVVPELSSDAIEKMGLTELKQLVMNSGSREAVLRGIDTSVTHMWYLVVALACVTMIGSLAMEWGSVKRKRE